jgi:hypothetical protein
MLGNGALATIISGQKEIDNLLARQGLTIDGKPTDGSNDPRFMEGALMLQFDSQRSELVGPQGTLAVPAGDEVIRKLLMLIEGECFGLGGTAAARKYGFCKQRYSQLRAAFAQSGSTALRSIKRGPKSPTRRTDEMVRQILRYRFLDPQITEEVIAQKLRQAGWQISVRSVRRTIADYGIQKKTLQASSGPAAARGGSSQQTPLQPPGVGRRRRRT